MLIVGLTLSMGSVVLPTGTAIGDAFTLTDRDASSFLFTGVSGQFAGLVVTIPKTTIATQPVLNGNGLLDDSAGDAIGDTLAYSDPVVFYDTDQGLPTILRTINGPGTFTDSDQDAITVNGTGDISVTFRATYGGGGFTEVTSNAITIPDRSLGGPSGFADPQFDDATDQAQFSAPFAGTLYAVSWNSANSQPSDGLAGFSGASIIESFSAAVVEGDNDISLAFSDTSADRFSYFVSDGAQKTDVETVVNTWAITVSPSSLASGGQGAYNGSAPISFTSFTLAEPTNVVVVFGGKGSAFGAVSSVDLSGQTLNLIAGAGAQGDIQGGVAMFHGTLPAGTYSQLTPTGFSDTNTQVSFDVLDVQSGAPTGTPVTRIDDVLNGENYTLDVSGGAEGDAVIMGVGSRYGAGDGVGTFTAIGGTEIRDTGTVGTTAGSSSGQFFVVAQTLENTDPLTIGGTYTANNSAGTAGVAVRISGA